MLTSDSTDTDTDADSTLLQITSWPQGIDNYYAEFVHGLSQRIADEVQHSMIWKLLYYVSSALEPFSYSDLMALLSLSCEDELEALITWLYPIVIVEPFKQYSE